jgi:alpha-tubulin suppressor-like RCC1 family protein
MEEKKIVTISLNELPNEIKQQIISYLDYQGIRCFLKTNKDNARLVLLFLKNKKSEIFVMGRNEIFWSPTPNELYECSLNSNENKSSLLKSQNFYSFKAIPSDEEIGEIKKIYMDNNDGDGIDRPFFGSSINNVFLLTSKGVYARGLNYYGELGLGHIDFCFNFTKIHSAENIGQIKNIFLGPASTLLLTDRGLYGSGERAYLGLGEYEDDAEPITRFTQIPFRPNVTIFEAAFSSEHSLLFTNQGLFVCGQNHEYQLGFLHYKSNNFGVKSVVNDIGTFTEVSFEQGHGRIKKIISRPLHSFFITDKNLLFAAGEWKHCLGLGYQQKLALSLMNVPLRRDITQIKQVIAYEFKTLLLTDKGIFVCGDDEYGEFGLGNTGKFATFTAVPLSQDVGIIKLIISSGDHSFFLTDKKLYASGLNVYGQLGLGDNQDRKIFTPVPLQIEIGQIKNLFIGEDYTMLLAESGLYVCGRTEIPTHKKNLQNSFTQIASFPTEVSNYLKYGYQLKLDINKVVSILDKDEKDAVIAEINTIVDKYFKHELPGQRKKLFGGNPKHTAEILRLQSEIKYIHAISTSIEDLEDHLKNALEPFMAQNPVGGERVSAALHDLFASETKKFAKFLV